MKIVDIVNDKEYEYYNVTLNRIKKYKIKLKEI